MKTEDLLQAACVRWFRTTFPHLAPCLFSVPNGGKRDKVEQSRMITTGLTPGVPDLLLIVQGRALGIEMKTSTGSRSPAQKNLHRIWEQAGNRVEVVRDLETFKKIVLEYLEYLAK